MFKIAEELMQKIESLLTVNQPALAGGKVTYLAACNSCAGSCGGNCFGSCAGSCKGTCTGSCQRYAR